MPPAGSLDGAVTYGRHNVALNQVADGIINPPIDELLEVSDSKYRLVIMAAKRARQINAYYSQLGEGLLEYVGPLVETRSQEKPLSISLREIKERLLNVEATEGCPRPTRGSHARVGPCHPGCRRGHCGL